MRKLQIFLVIGLFLSLSIGTKAQQTTFSQVLFDSLQIGIQGESITSSFDSGYIIAGTSNRNGIVLKVDSSGNLLWSKEFNNNNPNIYPDIVFNTIIGTKDSCFLVAGSAYINGSLSALCIKLNSIGDTLWSKAISQSGYNLEILSIQQVNDSGYVMAGIAASGSAPYNKVFAAKLDMFGNLEWTNILAEGNNSNIGNSIKQTPDSGYVITGYVENYPPYESAAFLLKLSPLGVFSWAQKYNISLSGSGIDFAITENGLLCYFKMGNTAIVKTDFFGNVLWSKFYMQSASNNYLSIQKFFETDDNSFVFVSGDCWGEWGSSITKIDSAANIIWSRNLFLPAIDVIETKTKELVILGNGPICQLKKAVALSAPHIGIIRTDSLGNEQTCVSQNIVSSYNDTIVTSTAFFTSLSGAIENGVFLASNSIAVLDYAGCVDVGGGIYEDNKENEILVYPNPSNGVFTLIASKNISHQIIIYNIFGQKILEYQSYYPQSEVNLSTQSKGVYFYKVIFSDEKIIAGKIIIVE